MAKKTISNKQLESLFSNLTEGLLTNKNVETVTVTTQFEVPKGVYDFILTFQEAGLNPNDVFSQMASAGFKSKLEQLTSFTTSLETEEKPKTEKSKAIKTPEMPDFSKLMNGLGQIQQLATQLQELEKMVNLSDDNNTTKKYSK